MADSYINYRKIDENCNSTVNTLSNFSKSHEKRLITKELIATHMHLNFVLNGHISTLAIKHFNSAMKLFKLQLLLQNYEPVSFYASPPV